MSRWLICASCRLTEHIKFVGATWLPSTDAAERPLNLPLPHVPRTPQLTEQPAWSMADKSSRNPFTSSSRTISQLDTTRSAARRCFGGSLTPRSPSYPRHVLGAVRLDILDLEESFKHPSQMEITRHMLQAQT